MIPLADDPLLATVPELRGYKFLDPCLLYGLIGRGGMGSVYLGQHLRLDLEVAVKCMQVQLDDNPEQWIHRFQREARLAASVNHQNLVRVYDVLNLDRLHYMVMEYIEGENARERIARKGGLALSEALTIAYRAGLGLQAAHKDGIIHRDIKPDNILISSSGEVKLADLGLAKAMSLGSVNSLATARAQVLGTPRYMPPEQWEDTSTVGPPADVYSLGATLYFLLAGEDGFDGESVRNILQQVMSKPFPDVRERAPDVPAEIAECIAKATAKEAEERFATASEFLQAIHAFDSNVALADPESGQARGTVTMISPPPMKTLLQVRREYASGTLPIRTRGDVAPTERKPRPATPAPTEPAAAPPRAEPARSQEPAASGRRTLLTVAAGGGVFLLAGLVTALVVLLGGGGSPKGDNPGGGSGGEDPNKEKETDTGSALSPLELAQELQRFENLVDTYDVQGAELSFATLRAADPEADFGELDARLRATRSKVDEALALARSLRTAPGGPALEDALEQADALCAADPRLCEVAELVAARTQGDQTLRAWRAEASELDRWQRSVAEATTLADVRRVLAELTHVAGVDEDTLVGLRSQLLGVVALRASEVTSAAEAFRVLGELEPIAGMLTEESERARVRDGATKAFAHVEAAVAQAKQGELAMAPLTPLLVDLARYLELPGLLLTHEAKVHLGRLELRLGECLADRDTPHDAARRLEELDHCIAALPAGGVLDRTLERRAPLIELIADAAEAATTPADAQGVLVELGDALLDAKGSTIADELAGIRERLFATVAGKYAASPSINEGKVLAKRLGDWMEELPESALRAEVARRKAGVDAYLDAEILAIIAEGERCLREEKLREAEKHFKDAQRKAPKGSGIRTLAIVRQGDRLRAAGDKETSTSGIGSKREVAYRSAINHYEDALELESDYEDPDGVSAKAHATYYIAELNLVFGNLYKKMYERGQKLRTPSNYNNRNRMNDYIKLAEDAIRRLSTRYPQAKDASGQPFTSKIQARRQQLGV